ncbi:hypothetical protein PybrP1_010465, partial [[Pythium] brassicae (nom. inval.)]
YREREISFPHLNCAGVRGKAKGNSSFSLQHANERDGAPRVARERTVLVSLSPPVHTTSCTQTVCVSVCALRCVQAPRKNALQACLNSHVISAYLAGRAARKAAAAEAVGSVDAVETLRRGAEALSVFKQLSAQSSSSSASSTPLTVVPTPQTPAQPLVARQSDSAAASLGAMAMGTRTTATDCDVVDLTAGNARGRVGPVCDCRRLLIPLRHIMKAANPRVYQPSTVQEHQPPQRLASRPPTPIVDTNEGDAFDDIDVDALVASHQQKQQTKSPVSAYTPVPSRADSSYPPRSGPERSRYSSGDTAHAAEFVASQRAEGLRRSIKETREVLRKVRDECDDASLEGDVPYELQSQRRELEMKLETLSRQFRECNSTSSAQSGGPSRQTPSQYESRLVTPSPVISPSHGEDSRNPRCSCGLLTAEAQVQHGVNAKRMYNRCSNCGFHSWASGSNDAARAASFSASNAVAEEPYVPSDPGVAAKMQRAKRVLRDVFGHNAFRTNQERVVVESFSGRDVFVLMPTGGGKSLCYQLPACIDDGVTIVISPLVSLIQDQVQQLQALDVGVAHLNGEQDYETEQKPIINELYSNRIRIKLLYVTPEKIASSSSLNNIFESLQRRGLLARFVIDEAHCISQWGHDFRKDYMTLGQLRNKFPTVPIMALTATANSQTEADIVKNLRLSNPFTTRSSFNRPNLTYDVRKKTSKFMDEIADYKDCEQTAQKLIKALGFEGTRKAQQISFYHAGLESEDRAFRHHEWSKGKIKLIVATVAFGMGINKPDVRYVIHHTIPQSVTHYYQQSRRRKLITKDRENMQHCNVHLQHLRRMSEFCENQVECRRTSLLEYFGEHFASDQCRETCDNCKNRALGLVFDKVDVTEDCMKLLKMVKALQADNESSTLVQISQVFLGQIVKGREWKKDQFAQLPGFGAAKGKYERSEVERILYHMVLRQYLREVDKSNAKGFTTTFLAAGEHAGRLQRGERVCLVIKTRYHARAVSHSEASSSGPSTATAPKKKTAKAPKEPKEPKAQGKKPKAPTKKAKKAASAKDDMEHLSDDFDDIVEVLPTTAQYPLIPVTHAAGRCGSACIMIPESHVEALAQLLKDWRASVCDNFNVMPYHILPTSGIAAIANAVPVTNAELSGIDGVGRIRVKKYGDAIIEIVKSYLSKHNLTPSPAAASANEAIDAVDESFSAVEIMEPSHSSPACGCATQGGGRHRIALSHILCVAQPPQVYNLIDDGLDDIDWGDVDESVLNQQQSKRPLASASDPLENAKRLRSA